MSVIYRERDRERFDDSRTTYSSSPRGAYTTVKRYRLGGEEDSRSTVYERDRRFSEVPPARVEETRIVRRERDIEPEPRVERVERDLTIRTREREPEPRYDRDVLLRREREVEESPRREWRREEPNTDRELVIRRTVERDEPQRDVRPYDREIDRRYERDYEVIPSQRDPYTDLQHYSRATEYYQPAPQPQTIIIRNEPIIIRERVRDDDYEVVRRSDLEDREVARREPPREEEYYYKKEIKEIEAPRREREDDFYERRELRREVSPHDSVSQAGGRRDRDYESDDSMVYVRTKETETYQRDDESPDRRRHLAEGVLAGVGAAEILRHHQRKEGRETSGGLSRIVKDVGAGAVGAVAATAISRAKSRNRSKSRRRERSDSRGRRRRDRSRSRSSGPHLNKFEKVGLGAAAIAAAVALAKNNNNNNNSNNKQEANNRRSRSRRRGGSQASSDDAPNPQARKNLTTGAGVAGAVLAGLVEHNRNKSRDRRGERSRSRVRAGLPIAAAGLGSAAIAHFYEKNKAKKEIEEAKSQRRARSHSRSRSRSRPRSDMYPESNPRGSFSNPMIEYGQGSVYGNIPQADYYGRPAHQEGYYSDAVVPVVPTGAGNPTGRQRERSRSTSRRRYSSSSSDHGPRRRRHQKRDSRSRSRDPATPAVAAAVGGPAASEHARQKERRKAERRAERERRRAAEAVGRDPYQEGYDRYTPSPPPAVVDPYAPQAGFAQQGYYNPTSQFPPPPGPNPAQYPAQYPSQQPSYNQPDHQVPLGAGSQAAPPQGFHEQPYVSGGNADPAAPRYSENVSAVPNGNSFPNQHNQLSSDGLNASRAPSTPPPPPVVVHPPTPRSSSQPPPTSRKSVQFDLDSPESDSPLDERPRRRKEESSHEAPEQNDSEDQYDERSRRQAYSSQQQWQPSPSTDQSDNTESSSRPRKHRRRDSQDPESSSSSRRRSQQDPPSGPSPAPSDETVDMPQRFDKNGRRIPQRGEDPLADTLDEILSGKGTTGKYFKSLTEGLLGGTGAERGGESSRSGRQRR